MKKIYVMCSVLSLMITCAGCSTVVNTSKGVAVAISAPVIGLSTGLWKDTKDTCHGIMAVDSWVEEHLW